MNETMQTIFHAAAAAAVVVCWTNSIYMHLDSAISSVIFGEVHIESIFALSKWNWDISIF